MDNLLDYIARPVASAFTLKDAALTREEADEWQATVEALGDVWCHAHRARTLNGEARDSS